MRLNTLSLYNLNDLFRTFAAITIDIIALNNSLKCKKITDELSASAINHFVVKR